MLFSKNEIIRYSRQIKLQEIGQEGQLKLKKAKILCVGAGGLGSSLLLYLAAAGIGTLAIIDNDNVELSNLQRQILYHTNDIGDKKVEKAKQQLLALNPEIDVQIYSNRFIQENAQELITKYDIIADCADNFATTYLINDTCFNLKKPYVFASINQFKGQCAMFLGKKAPCLRCLFPSPPAENVFRNCSEDGMFGVVPGLLGIIQANEIIKSILENGELLSGQLLTVDLFKMQFEQFYLSQNPECQLCNSLYNSTRCHDDDHIITHKHKESRCHMTILD